MPDLAPTAPHCPLITAAVPCRSRSAVFTLKEISLFLAMPNPNNTICVKFHWAASRQSQNPAPGLFSALLLFYYKDRMKFSNRKRKFSNGVRRSAAGISVLSDLIRLSLLNNSLSGCCDFTLTYKARGVLGNTAVQWCLEERKLWVWLPCILLFCAEFACFACVFVGSLQKHACEVSWKLCIGRRRAFVGECMLSFPWLGSSGA